MTDVNHIQQIISQLADMGKSLVQVITPVVLGGAKLQALDNLLSNLAWGSLIFLILGAITGFLLFIFILSEEKVKIEKRTRALNGHLYETIIFGEEERKSLKEEVQKLEEDPISVSIMWLFIPFILIFTIGMIFTIANNAIYIYGYFHPDAYLAYQAISKLTGN